METVLTAEILTMIGVGATLAGIGSGAFALLWRYIAAAERRAEQRDIRIEKRAEARAAELKAEIGALRTEVKADVADVKNELKADVAELKADVAELRKELKGDIADVKNELKGDIRTIVDRMERNHADLRQAIDTLIINDQAKRLSILEEAMLRTGAPSPPAPTG